MSVLGSRAVDLPFTRTQFLEVFAAYNLAVWPAQLLLTGLAIAMAGGVAIAPARAGRWVCLGVAALWTWTALAYHLAFFRAINPAAPLFAALGLGTAAAFAIAGARGVGLTFRKARDARAAAGWTMVAYALVGYPLIGALSGHAFPAAPTFGLPCPTTLFTVGLLLLAEPRLHRALVVGPLAWSIIGGTAAFALDVPQDYGLFVAAGIGIFLLRRAGAPVAGAPRRA
jgi:hypothetical protein